MFGNHGLCGLLEEGDHEKSPKCLGGNLGDFGEFCKGLICANDGLANSGDEFKIIIQAFLYKFLNDKYDFEVKKSAKKIPTSQSSSSIWILKEKQRF